MKQLVSVNSIEDIYPDYRGTPISRLLQYHNLYDEYEAYEEAKILIGMCMDSRKKLHIPDNFAYVLRTGGGNLRFSEFKISYAIAVGGIKSIALIGHDHCGMVNLMSNKDKFVRALVDDAGWDATSAEDHFLHFAPMFEIGNELDFVLSETKRLRLRYPKIQVAPLFYKLEDNKLYQIDEDS
jgi:carbonic anhydrase